MNLIGIKRNSVQSMNFIPCMFEVSFQNVRSKSCIWMTAIKQQTKRNLLKQKDWLHSQGECDTKQGASARTESVDTFCSHKRAISSLATNNCLFNRTMYVEYNDIDLFGEQWQCSKWATARVCVECVSFSNKLITICLDWLFANCHALPQTIAHFHYSHFVRSSFLSPLCLFASFISTWYDAIRYDTERYAILIWLMRTEMNGHKYTAAEW